MGSPVTNFTGSSQFAGDFQQVITRAVGLASLPLQKLQADQNKVNAKITAEQSLQNAVSAVNTALQTLSSSLTNTISTSVSNQSVLQATASANALPGTYTVQVTSTGSETNALSSNGLPTVTNPTTQNISSSSSFTLTVGSSTFTIKPAANNLQALAAAINSASAGVQATIINVGGSQSDYRLALQATSLGAVSVQLNDGTSNLLTTLNTGTNATYTVNGQPSAGISSTSSTVTIAPGLTATLQATGTATIQVANSTTGISNALSSFVSAYNAAVAELNKSHGKGGGPLTGESIISTVGASLRNLVNYSGGSGSIHSLTDLGLQFTSQGTLTFDPTALSSASPAQFSDMLNFLGNTSSSGFLQAATNTLNGLNDPTSGIITNDIAGLQNDASVDAQRIQDEQDRLTQIQSNLAQQLSAADALIAHLEQQTTFLTQLFNTTNANNFAKG